MRRCELFPLTTKELGESDLIRIVNHGLIPKHYIKKSPDRSLKSYVLDYIDEEIHTEALVRDVPSFARFLDAVSLTHGQLINYANIARDCGVSPKTAREYYQILQDTLLGHELPPWRKNKNRRFIETAKFYLFDLGVVRALTGLRKIQEGTEEFGRYFEYFNYVTLGTRVSLILGVFLVRGVFPQQPIFSSVSDNRALSILQ